MINDKANEVFEKRLNRYQLRLEKSIKVAILSLIVSIYCIINVI